MQPISRRRIDPNRVPKRVSVLSSEVDRIGRRLLDQCSRLAQDSITGPRRAGQDPPEDSVGSTQGSGQFDRLLLRVEVGHDTRVMYSPLRVSTLM